MKIQANRLNLCACFPDCLQLVNAFRILIFYKGGCNLFEAKNAVTIFRKIVSMENEQKCISVLGYILNRK